MPAPDLIERLFVFAVAVGKLVEDLPFNQINKVYCNQIIRCSSSVYANFRASQRAKSTADFIYKLKIVEEECDETIGFLKLLMEFNPHETSRIKTLASEGEEILKIVVASINTARTRLNKHR